MKYAIATAAAPPAIGPYSQAIAACNILHVSGQLPLDPATGTMPEGIAEQTGQALANVRAILAAAGCGLDRVVKVTIFLADLTVFDQVNKVYGDFFAPPYPARSCVQVARLPKGAPIEIEAIAQLPPVL